LEYRFPEEVPDMSILHELASLDADCSKELSSTICELILTITPLAILLVALR
jgi:hypothetical protein